MLTIWAWLIGFGRVSRKKLVSQRNAAEEEPRIVTSPGFGRGLVVLGGGDEASCGQEQF